jgi:hypothetical protein
MSRHAHRTTLPVWTVPTSGPSGPHDVEELLEIRRDLKPWSDMLTVCTEARSRQLEIISRLREANFVAFDVCLPGSPLLSWIQGMLSDGAMMLESFESVIIALDRYIAKKVDAATTNTSVEAVAHNGENAGQFPIFTDSPGTVTRDRRR